MLYLLKCIMLVLWININKKNEKSDIHLNVLSLLLLMNM